MKEIKLFVVFFLFFCASLNAQDCIECHYMVSPKAVSEWQMSKHSQVDVDCVTCHGAEHKSREDVAKAVMPNYESCNECHEEQTTQFKNGKHALAWAAMKAMPTIHAQPLAMTEGQKGCGGCHKQGIKTKEEVAKLRAEGSLYGHASCDACHTRHTFSLKEARQPQACQTCHQGFDHPQWEMYSSSKHGVRYLLKQNGTLPENTPAPTCQTCHMPEGNHEVRTAWGFLAVRLPMPEDEQWTKDRVTILQALGVLDLEGKPTALLETIKGADVARLTEEAFQAERNKMINVCASCHTETHAKNELQKGDDMIREADHLMAQAIREVAALYKDGIIKKPDAYPLNFPLLLTFHDAPTSIEQKLFVMFLEHRMRTFMGTFHQNPDYALWYGWSEMRRDLQEIKELASHMRK